LIPDCAPLEKFVSMPELLARVENDDELLLELLAMFQEELPGLQDALNSAVKAGDPLEIGKAAHTLKGMLANLCMNQGASLAGAIEASARRQDMPGVESNVAAFNSEMSEILPAVNAFLAGGLK
jgi:two-component system sensor histidine kinase/response regulator